MPGAQSDCEDCGNSFPLAAEHSDLCRKCKRLAPLTQSSEKYKEILVLFWLSVSNSDSEPFHELTISNDSNGSSVVSVVILDEIWFHVDLARFRHAEVNNALQ